MNSKGQINLGSIILVFIGIIVAISLFAGTINIVSDGTTIRTSTNETVTSAAINSTVSLTGRENTTAVTVTNSTGTDISSQFSFASTDSSGNLAIVMTTLDAAGTGGNNNTDVNVSYSYKPSGYDNTTGGRAILNLILLLSALAIAAFVIPRMDFIK